METQKPPHFDHSQTEHVLLHNITTGVFDIYFFNYIKQITLSFKKT